MRKHFRDINHALGVVRECYEATGESFRFLPTSQPTIGYFVEPWTNECLIRPKQTNDQPTPVSLNESDDAVTQHECAIREWIAERAHAIAATEIVRQAPSDWTHLVSRYEPEWFDFEFGATVVLFVSLPRN